MGRAIDMENDIDAMKISMTEIRRDIDGLKNTLQEILDTVKEKPKPKKKAKKVVKVEKTDESADGKDQVEDNS